MRSRPLTPTTLLAATLAFAVATSAGAVTEPLRTDSPLSPTALAVSPDGRRIYVAFEASGQVGVIDSKGGSTLQALHVCPTPTGLALSADGRRLYVTCAAPKSSVRVLDLPSGKEIQSLRAGHTALAPVLSPDGRTLYVCNRFDRDVSVIPLSPGGEARRIPVEGEPVAAALTPDGSRLLIANLLPSDRNGTWARAAEVAIIKTADDTVRWIRLPSGSGLIRGVAVSPDGRYAAATHLLGRYYLPATGVDFGRMNTNALSLLELTRFTRVHTAFLDNVGQGAANPWAIAWTADGKSIVVSLAGTHEVAILEAAPMLDKKVGERQRVPLDDEGPRALALSGSQVFVAGYFSDSVSRIDLDHPVAVPLLEAPGNEPSIVRRGEALFNDARLCRQEWQSCASCHSSDARGDGLNWDLPNDGVGNPKDTKSLLLSHQTPPVMSQGVRDRAETAVRAGIRHSLFTEQPEEVAEAIDAYLESLEPVPSPFLENGELSAVAQRGRKLFLGDETGCAACHPPDLFTNLQAHDVGTRASFDTVDAFDTPALVELWRTAPYLHDGSAATVRQVLTTRNPRDQHGRTSHLTPQQIDDLVAYLLSL